MDQVKAGPGAIEKLISALTESVTSTEHGGLTFDFSIPKEGGLEEASQIETGFRKTNPMYQLRDLAVAFLPLCCSIRGEDEEREKRGLKPIKRTKAEWNRIEVAVQDETGVSTLAIHALNVCGFGFEGARLAKGKEAELKKITADTEGRLDVVAAGIGDDPS